MDIDNVKTDLRQYLALKDNLDLLNKRQSEIKSRLILAVDSAEADDRGHRTLVVNDQDAGDVKLVRQRRVSKTLDMAVAEDVLTRKGIKDTCIKLVPTLDESAIMSAFYEGYLTEEDIDSMFPAKVTYAFLVEER
jgi:hypothetical protein